MTGLPVLWLYGPAGIGKTTTAWNLFTQLAGDGVPIGYVDIDQLGMCYSVPTTDTWAPEPTADPGRYRMKERNLDAVAANFQAAGARGLIVSGVIDADRGIDPHLLPHASLTPCRLRADPAELRRRVLSRGRPSDDADEVLDEAAKLDRNAPPGGICLDTTNLSVNQTLEAVRVRTGEWPGRTRAATAGVTKSEPETAAPPGHSVTIPGEILWLCGATGSGKSTVGWRVYQEVSRAGIQTAFVDLDQIGFHRPSPAADPGNHRLKARNLAALWQTFHASGAKCAVIVGPVDDPDTVRMYQAHLPATPITVCRLHATHDQLAERIGLRGSGLGETWGLPGDELVGQPSEHLHRVARQAAAHAEALECAAIGDLSVNTDGRPAQEIAQEILTRSQWPSMRLRNSPMTPVMGRPSRVR